MEQVAGGSTGGGALVLPTVFVKSLGTRERSCQVPGHSAFEQVALKTKDPVYKKGRGVVATMDPTQMVCMSARHEHYSPKAGQGTDEAGDRAAEVVVATAQTHGWITSRFATDGYTTSLIYSLYGCYAF